MIAAANARFIFAVVAIGGADCGCFFAAIVAAALGDINFAADDGLYVALAGFIEEIGSGKKVAVVGDGHSGHFLPRSFVEKFGGFTRTIQQAEVSVNVQMNELGIAHGIRL